MPTPVNQFFFSLSGQIVSFDLSCNLHSLIVDYTEDTRSRECPDLSWCVCRRALISLNQFSHVPASQRLISFLTLDLPWGGPKSFKSSSPCYGLSHSLNLHGDENAEKFAM
jgi:hypothetical protein